MNSPEAATGKTETPEPVSTLNKIEKLIAVASAVVGQAPWVSTIFGYPLSLYGPSIYHGKEFFLLIPLTVGVFATWSVILWRGAMWIVGILFLAIAAAVYWIFETLPASSPYHSINWIASYCAFALFVASLARALIDIVRTLERQ